MKKLITAGVALGLLSLPAFAQQPQQPGDVINSTLSPIAEWVNARALIAKDANQWRTEKQLIQQRIALYEAELQDLQTKLGELAQNQLQGADKRSQLQERRENLERAQAVIEGQLGAFERQVLALHEYFPAALKTRLSALMGRLPRDQRAAARISASNRMATIVAVLNEVDKFNNEVTVQNELRNIGGVEREVWVMYLGLAQAFYADANGEIAGIGVPAAGEWRFTEQNDRAADIARAISIARGQIKPAQFVNLPLQVTQVNAARR